MKEFMQQLAEMKANRESLLTIADQPTAWLKEPDANRILLTAIRGPAEICLMQMQGVDSELLERIIHRAVLDLARSVLMETCDECIDQIQTEIDRLQTIERAAMN